MTIEYRILYNDFARIAAQLPKVASRIVRETAAAMVLEIQDGMTGVHSGEIYGRHQASAPGEMPAVDLAALIGSLAVEASPTSTQAIVYVTPEYGAYLEVGAPNAGIAPRPFMAPASERVTPDFMAKMNRLEAELARGNTHR